MIRFWRKLNSNSNVGEYRKKMKLFQGNDALTLRRETARLSGKVLQKSNTEILQVYD